MQSNIPELSYLLPLATKFRAQKDEITVIEVKPGAHVPLH